MFVCVDEMHACTFIDCCLSLALTFHLGSPAKHVCDNFLSLSQRKILKLKICHRTLEGLKSCQKSSESARSAELSVALDDCWHE